MSILPVSHYQNEYLPIQPLQKQSPATDHSKHNSYVNTTGANNYAQKGSVTTLASTSSYVEPITRKNSSIPEYLYLQDKNNDHNYYEVIQYETVETSKRIKKKFLFINILIIILLIFIAVMLTIILYWKSLFSTNLNTNQFDYCSGENDITQQLACRRAFVRNMTISSFNAYQNYAWGQSVLAPISEKGIFLNYVGPFPGLTIIDAMSTLWVMDLKKEWEDGKHWISTNMPNLADTDNLLRVEEAVQDFLGGFLSAYFLSKESVFLEKAIEVMAALKPAFYSQTGMLAFKFNPKKKQLTTTANGSYNAQKTQFEGNKTVTTFSTLVTVDHHQRSKENFLANIGFMQPELIAISNLTGDKLLQNHLAKNKHLINHIKKFQGLYLNKIDTSARVWSSNWSTLHESSIDFYYNMIRSYIQMDSEHDNQLILDMYDQAINSVLSARLLWGTSENEKRYLYAQEFHTTENRFDNYSYDSYCLLGGMFALSSKIFQNLNSTAKAKNHFQLAVDITDTCHKVASQTKTKLLPHQFNSVEILDNITYNGHNLVEPYFILYRLTGEQKYRDWAWEQALALYEHARVESGGYSFVQNVNSIPTSKKEPQPAYFLSGTLKYLYLIFSEPSVLPLDKWFFNTRGHPLPICGTSDRYKKEMCKI